MLGIQQDAAVLGEQKSQDGGKRKNRDARKSAEKGAVALPTAPAPQGVAVPPKAPASKSFVFSSPPPTGNTLYPPRPQPQWELPPQLATPLAPTQEFMPGAPPKGAVATAKARKNESIDLGESSCYLFSSRSYVLRS